MLWYICTMIAKKYIPSVITSVNFASGFIAILLNDPFISPIIILFGSIFDVFDGAAARKLDATSPFGAELDSLSDVVTFGVAPAFLYYHHVLYASPKIISIIATTVLAIFGALRLAKFNIDTETKSNFKGMPIPSVGLFFAFLAYERYANTTFDYTNHQYIWISLPFIFAFLMVSPFDFLANKKVKNNNKIKLIQIIVMSIMLVSLVLWIITQLPLMPLAIVLYIFISLIFLRRQSS